jgi:hypothetical protein
MEDEARFDINQDVQVAGALTNDAIVSFASLDTTPSVGAGNVFKTANAGATSITNFDDGATSQHIHVLINDANTTIVNGATIATKDGADYVGAVGDVVEFILDGTVWREDHRLVTSAQFFTATGNTNYGAYNVNSVAANANGYFQFHVPEDFVSVVSVKLHCIVDPAAAGVTKDIDFDTMYATTGEAYNTHTGTDTGSTYDLSTSSNEVYEFDLTSLFASLAEHDQGGIHVKHNAIGGALYYLGVELIYKASN